MLWLNSKRILKSGSLNFARNSFVSLSAVLIMTITLIIFATILFVTGLLNQSLAVIQQKLDINVYFSPTASEESVQEVQGVLDDLPEVEYVEFVSKEQALENFKYRNRNRPDILEALFELEDNPFGAILNVKAVDSTQYGAIADVLEERYPVTAEDAVISEINYRENEEIIRKVNTVIEAGQKLGGLITILFVIVSVIITFNTIRLAMYISRDEIKVMRLVGASSSFISGPFIVTGILYGITSSILTLGILYPLTYWLSPITVEFFDGTSILDYYMSHFMEFFLIIFFSSILIGSLSSYIAIKKYLREARKRK